MPNYVYTTHPVIDSYARELGRLDSHGAVAIRQADHYILWFAFIAWLGLIFSVAITRAYKSFNIIAVIRLPISYAFCATRHPHPPKNRPPLYAYISPMGAGC
jgi:hypothetical protein